MPKKRAQKKAAKLSQPTATNNISAAVKKRIREAWVADPAAESHMRELGLEFELQVIRMDDIDRALSLRNNARIGESLIESLALDYAVMRESGDVFPAPVVSAAPTTSSKLYVTASGNHRTEMERHLDAEYLMAYVITTDNPAAVDTFARSINRKEGERQTSQEAMVHALHELQKDDGSTVMDVAEKFGLKYGTVALAKRTQDTRQTLETAGVEGAYDLSQDVVNRLYALRHSMDVMVATAKMVSKFALTNTVVRDMVTEIRQATNDQEKMRTLKKWTERYKLSIGKTAGTPRTRKPTRKHATQGELFRNYFGALHGFLSRGSRTGKSFKRLSQFKMSSEAEIIKYRAEWAELKQTLDHLFQEDA